MGGMKEDFVNEWKKQQMDWWKKEQMKESADGLMEGLTNELMNEWIQEIKALASSKKLKASRSEQLKNEMMMEFSWECSPYFVEELVI